MPSIAIPRVFAVLSAVIVAVFGALGTEHVMDPATASTFASVLVLVVTQLAHFADKPAPKA